MDMGLEAVMSVTNKTREWDLTSSGNRVKYLRSILGISLQEFSKLEETINYYTLCRLEGNHIPINPKIAYSLAEAAGKKGLVCSLKWLMNGEGLDPFFINEPLKQPSQMNNYEDYSDSKILQDVVNFRNNHANSEVLFVQDEAMIPFFHPRSYVGGIKLDLTEIKDCCGMAIIKLKETLPMIRFISLPQDNSVYLSTSNPAFQSLNQTVSMENIAYIAPFVWHAKSLETGRN